MTTQKKQPFVAPEGDLKARVVHVVRAGRHTPRNDRFNKGSTPRLWITYQLIDELNEDGNPRWMTYAPYGEPINSFFTELGKQAEWLKALGFRTNTEEALREAAGKPIFLDIEHNTNPNTGITYSNIVDVGKVRERDLDEFPIHKDFKPVYFDVYNPVKEEFLALPLWIKEYVMKCEDDNLESTRQQMEEWFKEKQSDTAGKPYADKKAEPAKKKAAEPEASAPELDYEDDVPF